MSLAACSLTGCQANPVNIAASDAKFSDKESSLPTTKKVKDYVYEKYKDTVLYECYVDEKGNLIDLQYTYGEWYHNNRQKTLQEYQINDLLTTGLTKEQVKGWTTGDYEDYYYQLPLDNEMVSQMLNKGLTPDTLKTWTKQDYMNFWAQHLDKDSPYIKPVIYNQQMKDRVKQLKLTQSDIHTLGNMGLTIEEMLTMSRLEIDERKKSFGKNEP